MTQREWWYVELQEELREELSNHAAIRAALAEIDTLRAALREEREANTRLWTALRVVVEAEHRTCLDTWRGQYDGECSLVSLIAEEAGNNTVMHENEVVRRLLATRRLTPDQPRSAPEGNNAKE